MKTGDVAEEGTCRMPYPETERDPVRRETEEREKLKEIDRTSGATEEEITLDYQRE